MIKYPVKTHFELNTPSGNYYFVIDSDNKCVLETFNEYDANIIANALNAMNEFPEENWKQFDLIIMWIKKYIEK